MAIFAALCALYRGRGCTRTGNRERFKIMNCSKIVELEEELRVVGNNLKSLELSEEKALEKEDIFAEQIRQLDYRLKEV